MLNLKRKISVFLVTILLFSFGLGSTVFANDTSSVLSETSDDDSFTITDASAEDIPEGVTPLEFDSMAEAEAFLDSMNSSIESTSTSSDSLVLNSALASPISLMSTYSYVTVDTEQIGIAGKIKLKVSYTTSGSNNTGVIKSCESYTTFTGFTLGFSWSESNSTCVITDSGKDVYARTEGKLNYWLVVSGGIKLGSRSITLSGTAYVIH